jgi:hypothetical protein
MVASVEVGREEIIRGLPPSAEPLLTPLLDVLQAVNRIRIEHGFDPIYELPKAQPAWNTGSTCVLQRAFADLGVAVVDYHRAYGDVVRLDNSSQRRQELAQRLHNAGCDVDLEGTAWHTAGDFDGAVQ